MTEAAPEMRPSAPLASQEANDEAPAEVIQICRGDDDDDDSIHMPSREESGDDDLNSLGDDTIHVWDEDSDDDDDGGESWQRRTTMNPFFQMSSSAHAPARTVARWWRTLLIGAAEPGSLSMGHVACNLFSSSLHPGVLLSLPVYFERAGVVPGMIVLLLVAVLGNFGEGLWVMLGRYVSGNTVESITGKACGMNSRWKRNLGMGLSSVLLVVYCTGAAVIAYHAMIDLLLQVFFHYSQQGQLFHNRAFVTLVVGGALTLPLLLSTTPKRNIIQIQTLSALVCYPVIMSVLLMRIGDWEEGRMAPDVPETVGALPPLVLVPMPHMRDYTWPWASTAMLPLLTLSASPAQILAHARSLRRKHTYDPTVTSFHIAQALQLAMILVIAYLMGGYIGLYGTTELRGGLHANFFSALPVGDDHVNAARILFALLLATHVSVCLASARSCWSRFLNLLNLHPLRSVGPPTPSLLRRPTIQRQLRRRSSWMSSSVASWRTTSGRPLPDLHTPDMARWRRFKILRSMLGGVLLWTITALTAYFSGVGGIFRLEEKEGEELRFLRSLEVVGILGVLLGFILPAFIWLILFRIRRPRAILLLQSRSMRIRLSQYLLSPLSALIGMSAPSDETEPLLGSPALQGEATHDVRVNMPTHNNEHTSADCDDATLVLLARKERELQRKTQRYVDILTTVNAVGKSFW